MAKRRAPRAAQRLCESCALTVRVGHIAQADEKEIDQMIESGESEQIWQKAIREQGRGQVCFAGAAAGGGAARQCAHAAPPATRRCSTQCKRLQSERAR